MVEPLPGGAPLTTWLAARGSPSFTSRLALLVEPVVEPLPGGAPLTTWLAVRGT